METSQLSLVDTHCHLYASEFDQDRTEMIGRAIGSGVSQMMLPNIDKISRPLMLEIANQFPDQCFPMIGLHPCSVHEDYQEVLDELRRDLSVIKYAGIGETGIDLYWDTTMKVQQLDAFDQQIEWAKEMDLPVIIHSRESLELNIDIIRNHQDGNLKGIFHCFGGNYHQAMEIYQLGFKIGIGGVVTFKNSGLEELLPILPPEMIVLETDAPYLAPVPYRGKRNEPAYLLLIAQKVATSLKLALDEVALLTTENAKGVFRKKG